jgi:hypothetical protein
MAEQADSLTAKRSQPEDAKMSPPPVNPTPALKPHTAEETKQDPSKKSGKVDGGRGVDKSGKPEGEHDMQGMPEAEQPYQYKRLKFQGELYEVGDTVLIRESETTHMVARIEKIIKENGDPKHPKWPMIQVAWFGSVFTLRFYKKSDIARDGFLAARELGWIGENEVFETDCISKVYADLLDGKCKVWDIKSYDGRSGLGHTDFYTRAHCQIQNVPLPPEPP